MVGAVMVVPPAIPPAAGCARAIHHGQPLQQLLQLPGVQPHHKLRRACRHPLRRHILPERQQLVQSLVLRARETVKARGRVHPPQMASNLEGVSRPGCSAFLRPAVIHSLLAAAEKVAVLLWASCNLV